MMKTTKSSFRDQKTVCGNPVWRVSCSRSMLHANDFERRPQDFMPFPSLEVDTSSIGRKRGHRIRGLDESLINHGLVINLAKVLYHPLTSTDAHPNQ